MNDETKDLTQAQATDIANLDAELAEEAKEIATALTSMPIISTQGGRFKFPDDHVVNGPLDLVILGGRITKQLWAMSYEERTADQPNGMVCAAISDVSLNRSMSSFASAPDRRSVLCDDCPENQWSTDDGPRHKVGDCKDGFIFAVMSPKLETDDIFLIRGSATGLTEYIKLMQEMKARFGHIIKGVARFDFVPTKRGALRLQTKVALDQSSNPIANLNYVKHAAYRTRATEMLEAEPRWFSTKSTSSAAPAEESDAPAKRAKRTRSAVSAS
jgi:hypothetical protein